MLYVLRPPELRQRPSAANTIKLCLTFASANKTSMPCIALSASVPLFFNLPAPPKFLHFECHMHSILSPSKSLTLSLPALAIAPRKIKMIIKKQQQQQIRSIAKSCASAIRMPTQFFAHNPHGIKTDQHAFLLNIRNSQLTPNVWSSPPSMSFHHDMSALCTACTATVHITPMCEGTNDWWSEYDARGKSKCTEIPQRNILAIHTPFWTAIQCSKMSVQISTSLLIFQPTRQYAILILYASFPTKHYNTKQLLQVSRDTTC